MSEVNLDQHGRRRSVTVALEVVFRDFEHALIRSNAFKSNEFPDLIDDEIRHRYRTYRLRRLRVSDNVLAVNALERTGNAQEVLVEIEIVRS